MSIPFDFIALAKGIPRPYRNALELEAFAMRKVTDDHHGLATFDEAEFFDVELKYHDDDGEVHHVVELDNLPLSTANAALTWLDEFFEVQPDWITDC